MRAAQRKARRQARVDHHRSLPADISIVFGPSEPTTRSEDQEKERKRLKKERRQQQREARRNQRQNQPPRKER